MSWLKKEFVPPPLHQPLAGMSHLTAPTSRPSSPLYSSSRRRLRIVASGTLFITHTISVPGPPGGGDGNGSGGSGINVAGGMFRAQSVSRTRGGSAATILSILCQFNPPPPRTPSPSPGFGGGRSRADSSALSLPASMNGQQPAVDAWLVAPLGRGPEATALLGELEREGVRTKLCARREGQGVPSAYVIKWVPPRRQGEPPTPNQPTKKSDRTVINYNPIPDLTHEEFIRMVSPLLYPVSNPPSPGSPEARQHHAIGDEVFHIPSADPPFDWLHFEGRTAQTTLSNMTGLDGFVRDRGWRSKLVFSLDCMRAGRPGQDALIPHADVIFFSKSYARSQLYTSPRAFLLAQALRAAPHALLVVSWADQGSALLSIPTREYFQSSKFVVDRNAMGEFGEFGEFQSVRTSTVTSTTWTERGGGGNKGTPGTSSSAGADAGDSSAAGGRNPLLLDEDDDEGDDDDVIDESGADDAFVAGMIYALSRRVLPNATYSPIQPMATKSSAQYLSAQKAAMTMEDDLEKGRWRLEECLRFATEMAGRKVRIKGFQGLARAMENVGWFED